MNADRLRRSGALLALLLAACAQQAPGGHGASLARQVILPGSSPYSWGWSQKPEGFANVERAQSGLQMWSVNLRHWGDISVNRTVASTIGNLRHYAPMHVRWKLKDGREFIIDRIDTQQLMSDYFRSHDLKL